jgi:8-oxo-dGTP pyrophosphatase MutT (NUDIX family)
MIVRGGAVLLGLRSPHRRICPNRWDFIGGHALPGENFAKAMLREVHEEIGVRPIVYRPLASIDFSEEAGEPLVYRLFRVEVFDGEPRLMNHEHAALGWFAPALAAGLPDLASPRYRSFLREADSGGRGDRGELKDG